MEDETAQEQPMAMAEEGEPPPVKEELEVIGRQCQYFICLQLLSSQNPIRARKEICSELENAYNDVNLRVKPFPCS